jgi:crossover junction endodeoxyribonuclease RuvC
VIAVGVDPGTRHLGWGVVSRSGNRLTHVDHGVIHTNPDHSLGLRLQQIERELCEVLERHRPAVASVETLFFHKDAQAAAKLGHARGVVLLSLARAGIEVAEYAPARVKRAIAGHGRADKRQVAHMISALLSLQEIPQSDAADALALAVTHLRMASSLAFALSANKQRAKTAPVSPLRELLERRSKAKPSRAALLRVLTKR